MITLSDLHHQADLLKRELWAAPASAATRASMLNGIDALVRRIEALDQALPDAPGARDDACESSTP